MSRVPPEVQRENWRGLLIRRRKLKTSSDAIYSAIMMDFMKDSRTAGLVLFEDESAPSSKASKSTQHSRDDKRFLSSRSITYKREAAQISAKLSKELAPPAPK